MAAIDEGDGRDGGDADFGDVADGRLGSCPICGHVVSVYATTCPGCHQPLRSRGFFASWLFGIVMAPLTLVAIDWMAGWPFARILGLVE